MANVKYINEQEVLELIIDKIRDINNSSYPNLPQELQDVLIKTLSDVQHDIEELPVTPAEAYWLFIRDERHGINRPLPPVCSNCKHQEIDAGRFTFCPHCGYKMKPPRFVGYLKGIK
jgi:hypothetical protein